MRIFSKIIILLFYSFTNAQPGDSEIFKKLTQSGRWGDYYVISSNNQFQLIKKDVKVDSVHFIGDKSIKLLALKKLFNNLTNSPSSKIAISRFKEIQDAHTFISNNSNLSFARYNQNNIAAVVDIETDFKSHIGGILGSSKDNKGEWKLNGEIDFNLEYFKDYDLKFKVDGNKLQGYVDNQLLIEAEDSSNPFEEGMMGFLTENGAIQSNSISIE